MRSLIFRAVARSFARTARKSFACSSAITEPLPDRRPLHPMTSELMSHELCVVSTFTGGSSDCSVLTWRSCSCGLAHQSLIAASGGAAVGGHLRDARGLEAALGVHAVNDRQAIADFVFRDCKDALLLLERTRGDFGRMRVDGDRGQPLRRRDFGEMRAERRLVD